MIDVDPNWWQKLFDEVYLLTDARSVCDQELTRREVDFLEFHLHLGKSDRILDMCAGQGRHSLELARRGYRFLTALDYSDPLINSGKAQATRETLPVRFIRADARTSGFRSRLFDCILLMANSFGYFPDDQDNLRILREAHRVCRPGGKLLLDLLDRDHVVSRFRPFSCHRASEDIAVVREREQRNSLIRVRESVFSRDKGLVRVGTYCARLYSEAILIAILKQSGFTQVSAEKGSFHDRKGDYGFLTSRLIVTARRES